MTKSEIIDTQQICEGIERIDPTIGVAIIRPDFTVKWANKAHLYRWPDLVDKMCYEYVNGFTQPCVWCPVKKTFQDKKMHDELVCSPSIHNKERNFDIVFSNIVSVPVLGPSGEVTEVVEAIFDNTTREKRDLVKRSIRYMMISKFGAVLERLRSEDHIQDYLLFGVVWQKCLNFPEAELFILNKPEKKSKPKVMKVRKLERKTCEHVSEKFNTSLSQENLTIRKGALGRCIKDKMFPEDKQPYLSEALAGRYGSDERVVAKLLRKNWPAIRINSKVVGTKILSPVSEWSYFLTALTVGTGHDLTTDRELLDVGIYGAVAERALRNRQLSNDVGIALSKCDKFFETCQADISMLYFAASVVSSFAHDLLGSCDILRDQVEFMYSGAGKAARDIERYRKTAGREIAFMKGCLSRAISVARMEKIGLDQFRETNINELIIETAEAFKKFFWRDKIMFSFSKKASEEKVLCEPLLIKQVVANLFANACTSLQKATHRVLEINVRTEKDQEFFRIIVQDNGLGIDPAIRDQIWRPFFSTKPKGIGTGLGLMICKRIVEDIHSGTIVVESEHGYWARFTVNLPIRSKKQ